MKSPNVGYLDTLESVYKYPTKKEFNLDNYSNHTPQNFILTYYKQFKKQDILNLMLFILVFFKHNENRRVDFICKLSLNFR